MSDELSIENDADVTVVIAAYNQVWCLAETVASVVTGQGPVQCLIVVDACPYGTADVARDLAARHPGVVRAVELSANVGQSGARDIGITLVTTPWVLFLDGDDRLLPGGIPALREAALGVQGVDLVLARFERVDRDGALLPVDRRTATTGDHVLLVAGIPTSAPLGIESFLTDFRIGPPGAWLVSTAFVRSIGGFDPAMRSTEDLEFIVRALETGVIIEIDRIVLARRIHDAQQTAKVILQRRTHLKALWRSLRRAPERSRPAVLKGATSCFNLRARSTMGYGPPSRQLPKAMVWRLVALGVPVAGWTDAALRLLRGPLPPPKAPPVSATPL